MIPVFSGSILDISPDDLFWPVAVNGAIKIGPRLRKVKNSGKSLASLWIISMGDYWYRI